MVYHTVCSCSHWEVEQAFRGPARGGTSLVQPMDINTALSSSPDLGPPKWSLGKHVTRTSTQTLDPDMALVSSTEPEKSRGPMWQCRPFTAACSSLLSCPQFGLSPQQKNPSASLSLQFFHKTFASYSNTCLSSIHLCCMVVGGIFIFCQLPSRCLINNIYFIEYGVYLMNGKCNSALTHGVGGVK